MKFFLIKSIPWSGHLGWANGEQQKYFKMKTFLNFFILLLGRSPGPTTLSPFKTGDGHAAEHVQERKTPRKK